MSSNYINVTEAKINNLSSASHSTQVPEGATLERALRQFDYDRVEELLKPYIVDLSQQLPDIEPLISIMVAAYARAATSRQYVARLSRARHSSRRHL